LGINRSKKANDSGLLGEIVNVAECIQDITVIGYSEQTRFKDQHKPFRT
jgi:hypothetical protein